MKYALGAKHHYDLVKWTFLFNVLRSTRHCTHSEYEALMDLLKYLSY